MHLASYSIHKKHPGAPPNRVKGPGRYFTSILPLLFALLVTAGLAQPTLEFVPANQTVDLAVTSDLTATIRVNGSGLVDAAEIHLNFDPTVLQVKTGGLTAGSTLPIPVQAPIFDNTLGTIDYAAVIFNTDVAAGFDLLTIEFEVIGNSSPSTVDYDGTRASKVTLDGSDILSGTTPLTVTIEAANTAPVVNITAPTEGADITRGQNFALTATVVDTEEPGLGSGLNWSSSDVAFSGSQSGLSITDQLLEPGPQTITASITDAGGLTGEDQITVNVSCPQVSFLSPLEAGNVVGTSVDVELDVTDLLFGTVQSPNEHLHFFINPPDVDNLDQSKRISTANDGPQTTFTFDENSGALAFDGNGNGIQLGVNTIVVVAAQANHTEFTCDGAKATVNFTVNQANTAPVITIDPTASVSEGGNVSVPLNITDADGDNLTVTITSVSNEPQDLQSSNSGKQVDPFPTTAGGFLTESSVSTAAGSYSSSLDFTPTFGDGGSNGDGSAVYTITVEVLDEDNNTISQTLDLTVNDVDQVVAENGTTRIEAESYDEQGPDNTSPGNTSDNNGIGVEIDPGGFVNIGFTNAGDFAEYEIDVETAGNYKLDLFVGVPGGANKGMEISSNGNLLTTFNPTATGGFGSYQIQSVIVALPAGSQILRFDWVGATGFQFNMDYFEFSLSTAPVIAAVDDQEIDEGSTLNVPVTVSGGDAPVTVGIVIYDKSVPGGINNPFTPVATVPASDYTFTETPSGSGNYVLDWPTGATDGKSYEARVTADDGINPVTEEVFQINVAQDILDVILARTFSTPITPYYGGNPPGGQFAIEPAGNIGWIDAGEFAEYLIDVPAPGAYDLRVNASKGNNAGGNPATLTISEESGGGFSSIGTLGVQNNGWPNFSDYTTTVIFTSAGVQRLRFDFGGGMNITEFEFTEVSSTLSPIFSSNIPDQFNLEGDSPAGLVAQASDPDGGTVTYSDNGTLPPGLSIDPNTGVISGTISAGAANGSPYAVVITATDDEPEIATLEFQWTVTVPVSLPVCVNCGNQPGVTAFGRSFTAEQFLASAPAEIFNKLSAPISGTAGGSGEEDLFQSETYDDPLAYAIPTGNGEFTVELYLVELYIGSAGGGSGLGAGDRVFNIDVEGQTENGIDLFSDYGPLVAATKTFAVTVADGILNINLDATTDNAKLAGFCITPTADFVANAAPTVTIDTQDDIVDCEGDGEDVTLTASASDAEQGDLTATIIWKDENGAQVGTGPSLALLGLTATATYTAEVTDATPTTTTESITVNIIGNTPPSLTSIQANPSAITVGGGVSLSVVASDNEDDDNTLIVTWSSDLETANSGELGTGLTLNPILTVEGTHTITASVTDACGIETTETVQVVVEPPVPCAITDIVVDNISSCDDNGTDTNLGDDTFTADITVTFNESAPTTGNLVLGDEATGSVPVGDIVGNSYTFTNVTMPADGTTIIVSAEFSDEPTCELTNINAGTAPEACSLPPCTISTIEVTNISACNDQTTVDGGDDTFTADITVTFNGAAPTTGNLLLGEEASGSVPVADITGDSYTFVGVSMPADGTAIIVSAEFSDDPTCKTTNSNAGTAPEACPCTDLYYADTDGDGYGDPNNSVISCNQPNGFVANADDCNDNNGDVNPNAQEVCNGIDDNCDGLVDDADPSLSGAPTWYADTDGDGFGDPNNSVESCNQPNGYVGNANDCNDTNGDVNPNAQEVCNGIDDDCDGLVDDADPSLSGAPTWYADTDGDGFGDPSNSVESCNQPNGYVGNADDCNDNNGDVNPNAQEVCNGIDDDCDGLVDDADPSLSGAPTWYADTDGDGFGDPSNSVESCNQPNGYVGNANDCNDNNGDVNPNAQEVCNGIDDDCDGLVDDADPSLSGAPTWYADTDGDGYGDPNNSLESCNQPNGFVANDGDCDDTNGDVNPDAQEVCDGIDNDCDGLVDGDDPSVIGTGTWYADTDEDGYGDPNTSVESCNQPDGYVANADDCNDNNGDVNPDAQEVCNGIDDDCDGLVDDADPSLSGAPTWYADTDGDGFGDPNNSVESCNQPNGFVANDGDCNDNNGDVNPSAQEVCNGIDDDCDGLVDDEDDSVIGQSIWYADTDQDSYGDPANSIASCNQPDGYVANDSDCDDSNGDVNPDAQEVCDGIDNDCDGLVDGDDPSVTGTATWYADTDEDGYGDPNNTIESCNQPDGYVANDGDCNDNNGSVNPGAQEVCNGIDDDCDGLVDDQDPSLSGAPTWYADTDGDGFGDPNNSVESCNQPNGFVANANDCNDNNGDVNPNAQEVCNGIDDDCDGLVDDQDPSLSGAPTWYADTDGDGFGDPNNSVESCNQPNGFVANANDCDDTNGDVNPNAQEVCNGIDDDCDGLVDGDDPSVIGGATWYADTDGDGYGDPNNSVEACNQPNGFVANDGDCNDNNGDVNPDAQEVCNGIDDDCDGLVDDQDPSLSGAPTWYADTDGDGFGDPNNSIESCNQPNGFVANATDCNDNNGDVNPNAQEVCNGIDDNCDGNIDEGAGTTWYADTDGDGYGDPANSTESCTQPSGFVANDGDCDDTNGDVNPDAQEVCNGIDDDCDGLVDSDDPSVIGGATWYADTDGDGYGDPSSTTESCDPPAGYVANADDCDDTNGDVNPDAQEVCNGIDDNCDGLLDEDDPSLADASTWYADTDGDGFGDPASSISACDPPAGYVANAGDCDDTDGEINPNAEEICDGIDNNCDGETDEDDVCVTCIDQVIDYNDFDDAWGIWNDGGTDCRLNDSDAPFAVGGTGRAVRLRDNTFSSVMTTDALDLSAYEDLKISFSFLTIGFDNILEDFWLQVSTDGSPNFTTIGEWDKGDEFENGIRYFEEVTLTGPFTSNMKFRFRCDASSDTDWLFIDNVEISGCFNPSALVANPDLENKTAKEGAIPFVSTDMESELETAQTNLQLFPNPVADELLVRFTMQEMTDVTVMVTDLQGRRIGREQLLNAQGTIEQRIAVEQYPAGIYLLHLITPEGKQIQKFVVARN